MYIYLQRDKQLDRIGNGYRLRKMKHLYYVKGRRVNAERFSEYLSENLSTFKSCQHETWRIAGKIIYVSKIY